MMAPAANLESLQRSVAYALTLLSFIHVPVLVVVGWWGGYNVITVGVLSLLFAAAPVLLLLLKDKPYFRQDRA